MPDLTWRPLTSGDAKASADLLNAMDTVDLLGENYTEADTLQELIDPYADLERASLAVFDGDLMVGFMKVRYKAVAEEVHRVTMDGGVHPSYRRRGVGTRLVRAGVAAAKVVHALHHPALKLVVDIHKAEQIEGLAELVRSQGFTPVRYFERMEHPLGSSIPATAIPDGLRVEPWSSQNDEEFRLIRNESYRGQWGVVPMPADAWQNKITNHTFRPSVSFLLRDEATGVAAGMLVAMHWEADVEVTGVRDVHFMIIGTLPEYRRRGVATALIGHALRAAASQGYDQASLNVDSESPSGAPGIFGKAGFEPTSRFVRWALEV